MVEQKRIYIVVKTYPTISEKYAEIVCTAGILEDGSWIRLYPVPFRLLSDVQRYPKYTWMRVEAERNFSDFRPESYRPNISTIEVEPKPRLDWDERRRIILENQKIYTNLEELIIKARTDYTSLVVFKPTKIVDVTVEEGTPGWDKKKLESLQCQSKQMQMFKTIEEIEKEFRTVQKVPYIFSYKFIDDAGKRSKLMIEDWETGMLYLNCLRGAHGNKKLAIMKVKEKYLDISQNRDIHFFLGTTKQFHNVGKNPFLIVGIFAPPIQSPEQQMSFSDL